VAGPLRISPDLFPADTAIISVIVLIFFERLNLEQLPCVV
jgi:hypothetical protein